MILHNCHAHEDNGITTIRPIAAPDSAIAANAIDAADVEQKTGRPRRVWT